MAIVFAVGGLFVGGLIIDAATDETSHSDYSDYDDYDDYDDAAVRRQKRMETLKEDAKSAVEDLADYKEITVNPKLESSFLREETAMRVSIAEMDKDAENKIQKQVEGEISRKGKELIQELEEIDGLLLKINEIERGNRNE